MASFRELVGHGGGVSVLAAQRAASAVRRLPHYCRQTSGKMHSQLPILLLVCIYLEKKSKYSE